MKVRGAGWLALDRQQPGYWAHGNDHAARATDQEAQGCRWKPSLADGDLIGGAGRGRRASKCDFCLDGTCRRIKKFMDRDRVRDRVIAESLLHELAPGLAGRLIAERLAERIAGERVGAELGLGAERVTGQRPQAVEPELDAIEPEVEELAGHAELGKDRVAEAGLHAAEVRVELGVVIGLAPAFAVDVFAGLGSTIRRLLESEESTGDAEHETERSLVGELDRLRETVAAELAADIERAETGPGLAEPGGRGLDGLEDRIVHRTFGSHRAAGSSETIGSHCAAGSGETIVSSYFFAAMGKPCMTGGGVSVWMYCLKRKKKTKFCLCVRLWRHEFFLAPDAEPFLYLTDEALPLAISRLQGCERGQESADFVHRGIGANDAISVPQDIERIRGTVQVTLCKGVELLGVLSGAWQSMEQRWPEMPSATEGRLECGQIVESGPANIRDYRGDR